MQPPMHAAAPAGDVGQPATRQRHDPAEGWSDQSTWQGPEANLSKAAAAAAAVTADPAAAAQVSTLPEEVLHTATNESLHPRSPQQQQQQDTLATGDTTTTTSSSSSATTTSSSQDQDSPGLLGRLKQTAQQLRDLLYPALGAGPAAHQPAWLTWPDADPVGSVNGILAGLWPELSTAVGQLVKEQVDQLLPTLLQPQEQAGAGATTGASTSTSTSSSSSGGASHASPPNSSSSSGGLLRDLKLTGLDLGAVPLRLEGVKVYRQPGEDSLMLEAHVAWGSEAVVTGQVTLALLGRTLNLPLTLRNLQVFAHTRVTLTPLLSEYPFAGSARFTLLSPPHVDFDLPVTLLGRTLDVMAFPLVPSLVSLGVKIGCHLVCGYPKSLQVELVEGGGRDKGPVGMLVVRVVKAAGLRSEDLVGHSDPYCVLQVKEGRSVRTRTVNNNNTPEFNEEFCMLVTDTATQRLQVVVKDDDYFGEWTDKVLGWAALPLDQAAFTRVPQVTVPLTLQLQKWEGLPSAGPLELPAKLLGLPLTVAATGGRALLNTAAGLANAAEGVLGGSGGWQGGKNGRFLGEGHADATAGAGGVPGGGQSTTASSSNSSSAQRSSQAGGGQGGTQLQQLERLKQAAGADPDRQRLTERVAATAGSEDTSPAGAATSTASATSSSSSSSQGGGKDTGADAQGQQGVSEEVQERLDQEAEQKRELEEDVEAVGGPQQKMAVAKGQDQLQKKPRGTVFLEVTYIPFKQPGTAIPATAAGGAPATAPYLDPLTATAAATTPPPQLAGAAGVHLGNRRGILSVTVLRATGLVGWVGEPDPYVTLELLEPDAGPTAAGADAGAGAGAGPGFRSGAAQQQKHVTSTMFNEDHPRWNETFDFIMVSASSKLLLTLWDKVTLAEIATSLRIKDRFKDHVLGRVKVEVGDVAAAGRLRRGYPLQGALMGHLELSMQWIPAELAM